MFKSNLSEEEIEEILGTLEIDKERFVRVRDKISGKSKKLKKVLSALEIFDKNTKDINKWIDSADKVLKNCQGSSSSDGDHIFQDCLREFEVTFVSYV